MKAPTTPTHLLTTLHRTLTGLVRRDRDGLRDLSVRQMTLLLHIQTVAGPHTVRGTAEHMNISKPAVTRSVDRLETLGLAKRAPDPQDGRSVLLVPTPKGRDFFKAVGDLLIECHALALARGRKAA